MTQFCTTSCSDSGDTKYKKEKKDQGEKTYFLFLLLQKCWKNAGKC